MYDILRSVIESGRYELTDMLAKIDTLWVQGDLTDEQRTELVAVARENASPEASYAPLQTQIDNLADAVADLSTRVKALESGGSEPEPSEEYPAYVQPTGAHDAYNTGDKITYNGKKYVCQMDGCVWTPDAYPGAWQEVDE